MVIVRYDTLFDKKIRKIRDNSLKEQIRKQIKKIIQSPVSGKPMRYARGGTREVYVGSFRISYVYSESENRLTFLDFYHKDKQ